MKWKVVVPVVALLCLLDSLTTIVTITAGLGFEENPIAAPVVLNPAFHVVKFVDTVLAVLMIHYICEKKKSPKIEVAGYASILTGYVIAVLNNSLIYLCHRGLPISFWQFAAIVFGVFFIALFL